MSKKTKQEPVTDKKSEASKEKPKQKVEPKELALKLLELANKAKVLIILLIVAVFYAFMLNKVTSYTDSQPTDDAVQEKTSAIKEITINPDDIEKIKQLKDTNVEIKSAFDKNRTNPFAEK